MKSAKKKKKKKKLPKDKFKNIRKARKYLKHETSHE